VLTGFWHRCYATYSSGFPFCALSWVCVSLQDGGPVLMDLLWSDPTTNDGVQGVQPSPRGPGLVTFGPDRVKDFCKVRLIATSAPLQNCSAITAVVRNCGACLNRSQQVSC